MVLENIDKDNNQEISIQELSDAVKDGGFLDKPENIQKVAEHIQENTDELTNTLKENLGNQINDLLKKESYTKQELKIIYLWDKLISQENNETKTTLIKKLDGIVQNISSTVNKKIGKNEYGNINYYSDEQVMAIQLHANIKYGEQIKLDGQRITNNQESGILFDLGAQTHDQQLTNLYIYKQELATRGQVIEIRKNEKNLLNIPNIDNLLQTLGNTEIQKKVFSEFLNFFLEIRRGGFFFENKIGTKTLEDLLNDMINAEKYKDTPIGKFFGEDGEENKIKEELKKKGYTMMGEYFRAEVAAYKNNIQQLHNKNKEYNSYLVRIHNANTLLDEIKKLEDERLQYKNNDPIKEKRRELVNTFRAGKIKFTDLNKQLQELEAQENSNRSHQYNKEQELLGQIFKKKLALYQLNPSKDGWMLLCLELKSEYPTGKIKKFFNDMKIDYKEYIGGIMDWERNRELLYQRDDINDILLQKESKEEIHIQEISSEEYSEKVYKRYNEILNATPHYEKHTILPMIQGKSFWKVYVPGAEPIYIESSFTNIKPHLPQQKPGKKLIRISNFGDIFHNIHPSINSNKLLPQLSDITFGYTYTDKKNNIIIEDANGNIVKTVTPDEQEQAKKHLQLANLDVYDHDMKESLKSFEDMNTIMEPLNKGLEKYQSGGVFASIFSSKEKPAGITQTEVNKTIQQLKIFGEKVTYAESQVRNRKKQKEKLKEIQKQSGGMRNDFEKGIDNMILTFDSMISFFEVKDNDTSQAREFKNQVAKIDSNNTPREAFKDFLQNNLIKMLIAIGAAVLAICLAKFTAGGSLVLRGKFVGSLRGISMIGAIGGMAGLRGGTILNEYLLNTFDSRYSDGSLRFNDPTDIERVRNKEITSEEFFANLAEEFARGTITTMTFIKAGQLVGNAMAKSSNQMVRNTQETIKRFMGNGNPQANHHAVNGFGKEFTKEFGQEARQEGREGFGEAFGNAAGGKLGGNLLGGLFSLMACLSGPSYAQISTKCNIAGGETKFNTTTGISTTSFTYDATTTDLQLLQNYWADQKIDVKIVDGKLIATQKLAEPMVRNGKEIHTQVYEYIPSHASTNTNNLVASLSREYDLTIKHEAKDPSGEKIDEVILGPNMDSKRTTLLQTALLMGKVGTITHHTDGTFTLNTTKESIIFRPSTEIQTTIEESTQTEPTKAEVLNNAGLEPGTRLHKAEALLGIEFTGKFINSDGTFTQLGQKILDAHNQPGEVYNLNYSQVRARVDILTKAGFTNEQIRVLFENGICGQPMIKVDTSILDGYEINTKNEIENKIYGNNYFELPLKGEGIEYKRVNSDGVIEDVAINEITIEQARDCFINGLLVSAEMFQGQNRVVLSSGSLFLNVEGYRKLGGDIDIATDVQTFINMAIEKTDGTTILEKYLQEGKIQDLKFTTIKNLKFDVSDLSIGLVRLEVPLVGKDVKIKKDESIDGIHEGVYLVENNKKYQLLENKLYEYPTSGEMYLKTIGPDGEFVDFKITGKSKLEVEAETDIYINKGDIRVEFNIKSKDGFLINTEFFPEPTGYGLIQLGTNRTEGKIREYSIDGRSITTVNEELAAKSYLINLAHEIQNNSIEGMLEGKKIKDATRINNIFEHLVSLGIKVPQDMIGFIEETILDYKNQPGFDGNMSKYLQDGLIGLEKTKEIFQEINNDYNIVKNNSTSRGTETTITFNEFIKQTYKIKKQLLDIMNNGKNIPDNLYEQIYELQKKVNINDPKSFAFYYELYILRIKFIKPISDKL